MSKRNLSEIFWTEPEDASDPENNYPPRGTPETALIATLDCFNYKVLWHTGRFFHGMCGCAGLDGEELGIEGVPDDVGYWMFEDGQPWGYYDDSGIRGTWRKARPEDFEAAGLECPLDLSALWDAAAGG